METMARSLLFSLRKRNPDGSNFRSVRWPLLGSIDESHRAGTLDIVGFNARKGSEGLEKLYYHIGINGRVWSEDHPAIVIEPEGYDGEDIVLVPVVLIDGGTRLAILNSDRAAEDGFVGKHGWGILLSREAIQRIPEGDRQATLVCHRELHCVV